MNNKDIRVDDHISQSAEFARPILVRIRKLVHTNCSDVNETIKWGMPYFTYKNKNLCHMAAFKAHCVFGFWQSEHLDIKSESSANAMGQFGKISSIRDLPNNTEIKRLISAAVKLIDEGVPSKPRKKKRKSLEIPAPLATALKKNKDAQNHFESLSLSHKREYVEWINEAKKEATRERRVTMTIELLNKRKTRHWKYK